MTARKTKASSATSTGTAKKAPAKKAAPKKAATKKTAAKKAAPKKTAASKSPAKKSAAKKTAAKKTAAKKTAAKKTPAKKSATAKTATPSGSAKKAAAKKVPAKKAPAKKVAPKKAASPKAATSKTDVAPRKAAAKKAAAPKKAAAEKVAVPTKAAAAKTTAALKTTGSIKASSESAAPTVSASQPLALSGVPDASPRSGTLAGRNGPSGPAADTPNRRGTIADPPAGPAEARADTATPRGPSGPRAESSPRSRSRSRSRSRRVDPGTYETLSSLDEVEPSKGAERDRNAPSRRRRRRRRGGRGGGRDSDGDRPNELAAAREEDGSGARADRTAEASARPASESRRRRGRGRRRRRPSEHAEQTEQDEPAAPPTLEDLGPPTDVASAAAALGIKALRPQQEQAIEHVMKGGDGLVVLPTGFGKSACYQIPAMLLPNPVVVISPLLALIEDQVNNLERRGIPVVRFDGTIRGNARKRALERVAEGGSLLVMTTPETLSGDDLLPALARSGISLLAVDEAHCASEWGHDFRPAYLRMGGLLERYGRPPVLAVTATATEPVREDLKRLLDLREPLEIVESPHRPNLAFEVIECGADARLRAFGRLVIRLRRPGIVYCSTTKDVDTVYGALKTMKIPVNRYHGGMNAGDRRSEQEDFMKSGRQRVMVATSAFGLGIDKRDFRYVIHFQTPASMEQYVQEAGRVGRDGKRANCILLHSDMDRPIHEFLLGQSRVGASQVYQVAKALAAYLGDGRDPDVIDLAAAARVAQRVTSAIVAMFESAGLLRLEKNKQIESIVGEEELLAHARRLSEQLRTQRRQDSERLDAIDRYAIAERCRGELIGEYFGIPIEEECGVCDICQRSPARPASFFAPVRKAARPAKKKKSRAKQPAKSRKRRGRGGKKRASARAEAGASEASTGEPKKRRRRRRRRKPSSPPTAP